MASGGLHELKAIDRASARDRVLIAMRRGGGAGMVETRKSDLIAMKERAAADPAHRRSKALRDRADVELLRGDVPDPDEGW
jgi:hypothetical protein